MERAGSDAITIEGEYVQKPLQSTIISRMDRLCRSRRASDVCKLGHDPGVIFGTSQTVPAGHGESLIGPKNNVSQPSLKLREEDLIIEEFLTHLEQTTLRQCKKLEPLQEEIMKTNDEPTQVKSADDDVSKSSRGWLVTQANTICGKWKMRGSAVSEALARMSCWRSTADQAVEGST